MTEENLQGFIGLNKEQAEKKLVAEKFAEWRFINHGDRVTYDFVAGRVNLSMKEDKVTFAYWG